MSGPVCVHFHCRRCGSEYQKLYLDSGLAYDEPLVCADGHNTFLRKEQTDKINAAFRYDHGCVMDVFL